MRTCVSLYLVSSELIDTRAVHGTNPYHESLQSESGVLGVIGASERGPGSMAFPGVRRHAVPTQRRVPFSGLASQSCSQRVRLARIL